MEYDERRPWLTVCVKSGEPQVSGVLHLQLAKNSDSKSRARVMWFQYWDNQTSTRVLTRRKFRGYKLSLASMSYRTFRLNCNKKMSTAAVMFWGAVILSLVLQDIL